LDLGPVFALIVRHSHKCKPRKAYGYEVDLNKIISQDAWTPASWTDVLIATAAWLVEAPKGTNR
jgi:hypothetical protein